MIQRIKNYIEDLRMRRKFARSFGPSREEKRSAKHIFMSEVKKELGSAPIQGLAWMRYALAVIIGVLALNGGAVLYADTTDVSIDHPLYGYKRVGEQVRITLTPSEKKDEVKAAITARRSRELKQVMIKVEAKRSDDTNKEGTSTEIRAEIKLKKEKQEKEMNEKKIKKLKNDIKEQLETLDETVKKLPDEKKELKKTVICPNFVDLNAQTLLQNDDSTTSSEITAHLKSLCDKQEAKEEKKPEKGVQQEQKENRVEDKIDTKIELQERREVNSKILPL